MSSARRPRTSLRLATIVFALLLPAAARSAGVNVTSSGGPLAGVVADAVRKADLSPAASVRVVEKGGVVGLDGWCATLIARERAAAAAEGASVHVRMVEVRLGTRPTRRLDEAELASLVTAAVQGAGGSDAQVSARASSGRVVLEGTVGTTAQKVAVIDAVRSVDGVTSIQDDVQVVPRAGVREAELRERAAPPVPAVRSGEVKIGPGQRTVTVDGTVYDVVSSSGGRYLLRPRT
jgi:osmotically-inducible protein OsmY